MTFNYAQFEIVIRDALTGRPSCDLPVREFSAILAEHLRIAFVDEEDHYRFERLNYWLQQPQLNGDRVVCANVELVRFGAIAAREDRKKKSAPPVVTTLNTDTKKSAPPAVTTLNTDTKKSAPPAAPTLNTDTKKSAPPAAPTYADPTKLLRMFKAVGRIDYDTIPRHITTVEERAQVVDEWVHRSRAGEEPDLPATELIVPDEQERIGNSKRSDMVYVDVDTLLTLIARSRNTTTLNEFCMHHAAATKRYLIISTDMKSKAIRQKDDQIDLLRREMAERDTAQQAKIDELLGYAKDTKDSLEDVKEQNDGLHTKVDDLQEAADDLLKSHIHLYKETAKIQRRVPAEVVNPDRRPYLAMTHIMYNHETNGPTIRMFVRFGMRATLAKNLIELMSGNYKPNRNLIVQARHQLTFAPVHAPDQRNWIDNAQKVYKIAIQKRTHADRTARSTKLRNLGSAIKRITADLDITDANMKKQNISVITHRIFRDSALMRSATTDDNRALYASRVAKLEKDLKALQLKVVRLENERDDLKANPIAVPVKFESMYIDYQTNKYIKMPEIIRIFEELIINTHGAVYLSTMRAELLEEAVKCQQEFISDWYASNTNDATTLRAEMKEAIDASGERISRKVAESALSNE